MAVVNSQFEGFDESAYLEANPDVREAVRTGAFSSGWQHYITGGYRENRAGISPKLGGQMKDVVGALERDATRTPPPPHLREKVHGSKDLSSFEEIGRTVAFNIYAAIEPASITLPVHGRILDFGCGCGRVMRYFRNLYDKCDFYGTDIDKEAIAWCQNNLQDIGTFNVNKPRPPLPFEEGFFDFVYSISVFTHLPEDLQFIWLEELRRVTKPNGYLLLTTHGQELFPIRHKGLREKFMPTGFYYSAGLGTRGFHVFYQTAFHAEQYISSRWSRFFEIIRIMKKGITNYQDIVLCRRR